MENKFITSIKEGRYVRATQRCAGGALGTFSVNIMGQFTLKEDLWRAVFHKLGSGDDREKDYVFNFFMHHVQNSYDSPPLALIVAMLQGLKAGDTRFQKVVETWRGDEWEERSPEDPWRKPFEQALAEFEAVPQPFEITDDDVPF
jgi:hypothetical protein